MTKPKQPAKWMQPHAAVQVAAKLGQVTGGDDRQREAEARILMKMIGSVDWQSAELPATSESFLEDMFQKANSIPTGLYVSGRQLFWLRDIKDRLVAEGLL